MIKKILIGLGVLIVIVAIYQAITGNVPESSVAKDSDEVKVSEDAVVSDVPTIKGSQAYDIVLSLEEQGLSAPDAVPTQDGYSWTYNDSSYSYYISSNTSHEVISASFTSLSQDNGFLAFCATMPYDSSDANKAQAWVSDNFGTDATITIGDADFKLTGGDNPSLSINAQGFEDYVLSKVENG